jgi:hypothetical protein
MIYFNQTCIYYRDQYHTQYNILALGKVWSVSRNLLPLIHFKASPQDGLGQARSGSCSTGFNRFWKSSSTQSMMRIMRWGGFPSFRTVEMWPDLIVFNAASASSKAGLAASNFAKAIFLSD